MTTINHEDYIARTYRGGIIKREWWLVKHRTTGNGVIKLGSVVMPKKFIGKRVRFKVEIIP